MGQKSQKTWNSSVITSSSRLWSMKGNRLQPFDHTGKESGAGCGRVWGMDVWFILTGLEQRLIKTCRITPKSPITNNPVIPGGGSLQFSSVTQSCPTLCHPMDCSIPGFSVHHQHLELAQTHVYRSVMPSNHFVLCHLSSLSSCLQSFPASGSFQMSQLFPSGGQSTGASASVSVLPMNTQDWFPLEITGLISFQSKGFSRVFSNTTVQKHQFWHSPFFMIQLSHPYITSGKNIA